MATTTPSATPQKRVLPARERRESATKREASETNLSIAAFKSTPAKRPTSAKQTPKTTSSRKGAKRRKSSPASSVASRRPSTPLMDETLPTKIVESKPLPTLLQPQPAKLSSEEYRSVAESAVLAASLYRSRVRWLADGIFERYWTKPTKKKMAEGLTNNPDLKSMQKLGASTVSIGPHTYEAIIYMVRDTTAPRVQPHYSARPLQPTFQNYHAQPHAQPIPPIRSPAFSASNPPLATHSSHPGPLVTPRPIPVAPQNLKHEPPARPNPPPASAQSSGPDPVIRLLATRAASNPQLKELMKVVASSKASPEQLQTFQSHIDELNKVIRSQQEAAGTAESFGGRPAPIQPANEPRTSSPHPLQQANAPPPGPVARPPIQTQSQPSPPIGYSGPPLANPAHPSYPPPPKLAVPEPQIKAIVLEFTTPMPSSGSVSPDRYLFPAYAVLDTPQESHGLEMICSFFVVRTGAEILAMQAASTHPVGGHTRWAPSVEYYEPVTMTIKTSHNTILKTVANAAKPLPEVQDKMKEIMRTKTRASLSGEWLAARLPREGAGPSQV